MLHHEPKSTLSFEDSHRQGTAKWHQASLKTSTGFRRGAPWVRITPFGSKKAFSTEDSHPKRQDSHKIIAFARNPPKKGTGSKCKSFSWVQFCTSLARKWKNKSFSTVLLQPLVSVSILVRLGTSFCIHPGVILGWSWGTILRFRVRV